MMSKKLLKIERLLKTKNNPSAYGRLECHEG